MGRSLSIIKHNVSFLTTLSTRQVLQALILLHLDYCSVVWSGATKRYLQLAQNRAARLALKCIQRAYINDMHVTLHWLKVEERLTSSLLVFVRGVNKLNSPRWLFKLLAHSSDTHAYPTSVTDVVLKMTKMQRGERTFFFIINVANKTRNNKNEREAY